MLFRYAVLVIFFLMGCEAVHPEDTSLLVVESYVAAGQPLPPVTLKRTAPLEAKYDLDQSTAAAGARVEFKMQDSLIPYTMQGTGVYAPLEPVTAIPGAELDLKVYWGDHVITANSRVPPPVSLDSVSIEVSDTPIPGLILDSVFVDPLLVDSLGLRALGANAREGLVYLVEATLYWTDNTERDSDDWWMRTQLLPRLGQSPRLSNFFLSPEALQRERSVPFINAEQRSWSGAYAVQVPSSGNQLPAHGLRISIVRGTSAYAQFVAGSSNPGESEPPSNVTGALGIFTGLAIDTLTIEVQ
ncbi:MAG: DUF4249 family protein [Rhodothermaceae bacterium]|nr:DUF4249 family protein [Rhodothermaceae bacterium]MYF64414.1 DUF4249 family protein [Rhodothermaceae bacterium]MYI84352.1 DUF4249 family protein [Rhodothermaceae bacterium]